MSLLKIVVKRMLGLETGLDERITDCLARGDYATDEKGNIYFDL